MKQTAVNQIKNRIKKKLSGKKGFSLGELLAATIIILLASQVMTQGMAFATRMYNESMSRSHAKQLCSTLTNVIETELRYTTSITTSSTSDGTVLATYFSPNYGETQSSFCVIDNKGVQVGGTKAGEIAVKVQEENGSSRWQKLISSASYSSFNLKALIDSVKINRNTFQVRLQITDKNDNILVTSTFDVIPVNELKITASN